MGDKGGYGVLFVVFIVVGVLALQSAQMPPEAERVYCELDERAMDTCLTIYEPVCGWPERLSYSNACFACSEPDVEYYVAGEC